MGILEQIIDPDRPIIDAHHHLWMLPDTLFEALSRRKTELSRAFLPRLPCQTRYLFDEFAADTNSGHKIVSSVYVDAHSMYRADGGREWQSIGEIEFAAGVAAIAESGTFAVPRICAAIVGNVDLRLGDAAAPILEAHIRAGGGRYRGVRGAELMAYDPDPTIIGQPNAVPGLLLDADFRRGFKYLESLGLSFDAWLLEPQLSELIDLARAFPNIQMILNHCGGPLGVGHYAAAPRKRFERWRAAMRLVAEQPNVAIKIGGLGLPLLGFETFAHEPPSTSIELANEWRPYIETCIELFGADRAMFESNFPVDARTCSYRVLWNALKRVVSSASETEKSALFSRTAERLYRMNDICR